MAYWSETTIPVKYMDITVSLFRRLVQEDEMIPHQRDRFDASSEPKAVWWTFFLEGPCILSKQARENDTVL